MRNDIKELLGHTMKSVVAGDDTMTFIRDDGKVFQFYHGQDCCESVRIEDLNGHLDDLVGHPLLVAEEVDNLEGFVDTEVHVESFTWTFYRFATQMGWVVVRWLGESNGYYSESVDLCEVK